MAEEGDVAGSAPGGRLELPTRGRLRGSEDRLLIPGQGRLEVTGETELATRRELTRAWIAKVLVGLMCTVFLSLIGFVAWHRITVDDALSIIAPLTAVVGTALGFYFGGHRSGP